MAPVVETITDPHDPRVTDFTGLTDVELRSRREPAEGLFLAEGAKIIRRAVAAGYEVRSFLMSERWLDDLADVVEVSGAPAYVAEDALLEQVTGYQVHRGALASCARGAGRTVADVLATAQRVVVLEDLNDHTNVGLVFRSAAALGVDAVLLAPRCADPLYRRAVKTSMGATLVLPYARLDDWYHGVETLQTAGFSVLALTPDPAAERLEPVLAGLTGKVALVVGAEGDGISPRWLRLADHRVRIAQRAGIDSLNAAAAAAIACYALGAAAER